MGCGGGYRSLFRILDCNTYSSRGCGDSGYDRDIYYRRRDDTEEKIALLKRMLAEGIISEEEYKLFNSQILDRRLSFDRLVEIRMERLGNYGKSDISVVASGKEEKGTNQSKIKKLLEAKKKVQQVCERLDERIEELKLEREKMIKMAETMVKTDEKKTEEYISNRLTLEESIQNLERKRKELDGEVANIDRMIKELETKELELEALRLQEELSNMKIDK
jgi:prefoldin subunit 5